ncbi:MAG: membrane integrity-associated transporter subunit PqiC [Chitinispirillaceae bacterium]|nr:membrane integrity-associated transporter subunit PqiC [Chitinispirillaceae bacterium]
MNRIAGYALGIAALFVVMFTGCFFSAVPIKEYYMLNYNPSAQWERLNQTPYPCAIRLRDFDIEEAYNRLQIVYRQSPFLLQYYYYRVWAVKPARMVTDLVHKHVLTAGLVSNIIRRFDEGPRPDFELSGMIEALDEYDSQELWFAHIALRMTLSRISDGGVLFEKRFDLRKRVYEHKPENVIREISSLLEYIMTQSVRGMDASLAKEFGIALPQADTSSSSPAAGEIR